MTMVLWCWWLWPWWFCCASRFLFVEDNVQELVKFWLTTLWCLKTHYIGISSSTNIVHLNNNNVSSFSPIPLHQSYHQIHIIRFLWPFSPEIYDWTFMMNLLINFFSRSLDPSIFLELHIMLLRGIPQIHTISRIMAVIMMLWTMMMISRYWCWKWWCLKYYWRNW